MSEPTSPTENKETRLSHFNLNTGSNLTSRIGNVFEEAQKKARDSKPPGSSLHSAPPQKNDVQDSFLFIENTRKDKMLAGICDSQSDGADLETEANPEASPVQLKQGKANSISGLIKEGQKQKKNQGKGSDGTRSIGQKVKMMDQQREEDEKFAKIRHEREAGKAYMSTLSTKYNPDIIAGSVYGNGKKAFLQGNEYYTSKASTNKRKKKQKSKEGKSSEKKQEEDAKQAEEAVPDETEDGEIVSSPGSPGAEEEDQFSKNEESEAEPDLDQANKFDELRKQKGQRYWADENPTIKCHNCHLFGHMARDCPNDTKRLSCILCGKDTHDSFECNEKMCFKCNKVGHQMRECREKNVILCNRCGYPGHKEIRCLKQWTPPPPTKIKHLRCIECGKQGHIKCTTEDKSDRIKIDSKVMNDLNEFIMSQFRDEDSGSEIDPFDYVDLKKNSAQASKKKKLTKKQKAQRKAFLNDSSNIIMAESSSSDFYSESSDEEDDADLHKKIFGESEKKTYCAICASNHTEEKCPNKWMNRQLAQNVRDRLFAQQTKFKQVGEAYDDRMERDPYQRSSHRDREYYDSSDYRRSEGYDYYNRHSSRQNTYEDTRPGSYGARHSGGSGGSGGNYNRGYNRNQRDRYQNWRTQGQVHKHHSQLKPAGHDFDFRKDMKLNYERSDPRKKQRRY